MDDMIIAAATLLTILLFVYFLAPLCVSLLAARLRPAWPDKRLVRLATFSMPALTAIFVILLWVLVITEESGRVDTVDDAPQRALFVVTVICSILGFIGLAFGYLAGKLAIWCAKKP